MAIRIKLHKPLEHIINAGHPWVYRNALEPFQAQVGDEVIVLSRNGRFVARGFAEEGPIGVRIFRLENQPIDMDFIRKKIRQAIQLRESLLHTKTTAYRLIHGEGDQLPGVVVDMYDRIAVLRLDGASAEAKKELWVSSLLAEIQPTVDGLLIRTGRKESKKVELAWGKAPAMPMTIVEHGMKLLADLDHGQKTGLFLDHRESRLRTKMLSKDKNVLNLYGYNGGFSVAAGLGEAAFVTTVDIASHAIESANQNWLLNSLDEKKHLGVASDVPNYLQQQKNRFWDLIISDPPSFAPSERAVEKALLSYTVLHTSCLEHLQEGGFYLAASCSSHIRQHQFEETLIDASERAHVTLQILERWGAPFDHPRIAVFPESDYLKVVLTRVVSKSV